MNLTARHAERLTRFLVQSENGCLLWTGATYGGGRYGHFKVKAGEHAAAHRVAWLLAGREIPEGMQVLHNCPGGDNPLCCNVDHLWLGTMHDNMRDRREKGRCARHGSLLPWGVNRQVGRFGARAWDGRKTVWLGSFSTAEEAGKVAAAARLEFDRRRFGDDYKAGNADD
ncbi:MAG TPA: HNH endonuclease [Myxococcales bacterium]|nr:HNH endonuclease [Myxococcales bacterium]